MPEATVKNPVAVRHPVTGQHVAVRAGDVFPDDHPFVAAQPWLFGVEQATAGPGEKRNIRYYCDRDGCRSWSTSQQGLDDHVAEEHGDEE